MEVYQNHHDQAEGGVLVQGKEPFLSVRAENLKHAQYHRKTDRHHEKHRQPEGHFPAEIRRVVRVGTSQSQQVSQTLTVVSVEAASITPADQDHASADNEHRGESDMHHQGVAVDCLAQ